MVFVPAAVVLKTTTFSGVNKVDNTKGETAKTKDIVVVVVVVKNESKKKMSPKVSSPCVCLEFKVSKKM